MSEGRAREEYSRRHEVTVLNWIGTILLFFVPVILACVAGYLWNVNLVILIGATLLMTIILMVVLMLTTKRASKRNFMVAALIVTVVFTVVSVLGCAFYGSQMVEIVRKIGAPAASVVDMLPAATSTPEATQVPEITPTQSPEASPAA